MRALATLGFDRASVRSYDTDGRLHIASAHISAARVNGYLGSEIPDAPDLGLEPNRTYQLLRDPEALRQAAKSFNNLPILTEHVPVSAADWRPDLVVGSTGTDAEFNAPFLDNSLVVWAAPAIDRIESGEQQQLSAAYRYKCVLEPGSFEGKAYDGRMVDICGHHIALVPEGRVGPDIVVGDRQPRNARQYFHDFPEAMRFYQTRSF